MNIISIYYTLSNIMHNHSIILTPYYNIYINYWFNTFSEKNKHSIIVHYMSKKLLIITFIPPPVNFKYSCRSPVILTATVYPPQIKSV